jgi:hypothetical protein
MARIALQEMMAVQSPAMSWNWDVFFPRIPGISDTRDLSVRATTASLPGWAIEQLKWSAHGRYRHFAGKPSFDETFTLQLLEVRGMDTYNKLTTWRDFARPFEKTGGALASEYAVPIDLTLYDEREQPAALFQMVNAWIQSVSQVDLGQDSGLIMLQTTFSLDYVKNIPVERFN